MSFAVFTDSCSNLPGSLLQHFGIRVLPCSYTVDGKQIIYGGDIEAFDAHTYYELLRQGKRVTTSLLHTQVFLDHFRPALEQGLDVVYVGLSAGISGTYQAACIAAAELRDEFPERTVCPVDSMGAGFGTGLLACRAAELRDEGRSAAEATAVLEQEVQNLCEFFTVSDLMFLHRTGRVQAAAALVGTVLNLKPILRGDEEGHIVTCEKVRGRARAIANLAARYETRAVHPELQRVAITHGDCPEDAQALAERIEAGVVGYREAVEGADRLPARAVHGRACRPRHAGPVLLRQRPSIRQHCIPAASALILALPQACYERPQRRRIAQIARVKQPALLRRERAEQEIRLRVVCDLLAERFSGL